MQMSPSSLANGIQLKLDATWSASQIAQYIQKSVRDFYGDRLDIDGIQKAIDEIWVALHNDLTDEERKRIGEVVHVSVPLNDFNARIAAPPSGRGYFVLFDAMLDLRLAEIFTAPRHPAAWVAAYVRAAWGNEFTVAFWAGPAVDRLTKIETGWIPDSYSLQSARDFIFAHECGHFFLNHLTGGRHQTLHFGSEKLEVFDPALKQEIQADACAREILSRSDGRPLIVQQKGVDWLFGFMGAVMAMRERAEARRAGDTDLPTMDVGMARRRALSWDDYNRRRERSPHEQDRTPANVVTLDRLRQSIDNFNDRFPPALADIYAERPEELMDLQVRVITSEMTEDETRAFWQDLVQLENDAAQRRQAMPRRQTWRGRLRKLAERLF
jgi:hypothetical protein